MSDGTSGEGMTVDLSCIPTHYRSGLAMEGASYGRRTKLYSYRRLAMEGASYGRRTKLAMEGGRRTKLAMEGVSHGRS